MVPNYFMFMTGTPQQEVTYAAMLLRDAAHHWWTGYLHRRDERMSTHWASVQFALLDRFSNKLQAKQAVANIVNLSQGSKSVREYVVEFKLNTRRLDSSYEITLMQFFIWGLHRDIIEGVLRYSSWTHIVRNSPC